MRNNKIIVGIILIIAILLVTIGYAAISDKTLKISGETIAEADQKNFIVKFTGKPQVSDKQKVTAKIVDDLNATINVQGLSAKGDEVYARYTVINESPDLSAELIAVVEENTNPENFEVSYEIEEPNILNAGESTMVVVRIRLLKTLITNNESTTVKVVVTAEPIQPTIAEIPEIPEESWVSPGEIFDETGADADKLHIGDFVNYDAGYWTQEEIDEIQTGLKSDIQTANGSADMPESGFQFGGFVAGRSKNGNATPMTITNPETNTTYFDYVKDKTTGKAITGWRVFDIEEDGKVILISAGNSEDYYHPYIDGKAYQSEYILTGNINSNWENGETEAENYQIRSWNNYINSNQKAESATVLTKSRLDRWYSKYTGTASADTINKGTFQKIYQEPYTKYQSIVDNGTVHWLSGADDPDNLFHVDPLNRRVGIYGGIDGAISVRVLVSLSSDVKITETKTGTKTVEGAPEMPELGIPGYEEQTYNCWMIK